MSRHILVLGGAHLDRRGRIAGATAPGASNPGSWLEEAGGGGFNAARNLARLGFAVRMISPRGGDAAGDSVAQAALAAGIDDRPFVFLDRRTPSYTAILEKDGNLVVALADMELYRLFSPRRLRIRAVRDAFAAAELVFCDANLPQETVSAIAALCTAERKPLAAIGISPAKIVRLKPSLAALDYLFMNEAEAEALTGQRPQLPEGWPALLRQAGLRCGVVTRGRGDMIGFDQHQSFALLPPEIAEVADVTGAGDALAAGIVGARLSGMAFSEALRWGAAAAALTVQSPQAAADNLSRTALAAILGLVPPAKILS
jgi:sugar/nucleoside kinase (ribokinase family)